MADIDINIDEGQEAPSENSGGQNVKAKKENVFRASAPSISDILSQIGRQSELSVEGVKFVESLTDVLTKEMGDKITVARVPDKLLDIYRVSDKTNSILMTFSETYSVPSDSFVPPTEQIVPAAQLVKNTTGTSILNNIVITPNDYRDVGKWSAHIVSMMKLASGEIGHITINSLSKGKYSVSTNIGDVKEAIKRFNPKSTMPRTDIGLVLYANEEIGVANNQGPAIRQATPILVIGGYTSFVSTAGAPNSYALGNNSPSFLAIATITSILSPIMTSEMISLAIPLATEEFIRLNGWLKPFTKFGKKDPNLGSLVPDEKGKPFFIEDMTTLMDFASKNIARPYLAVDVTDGYARIPGIEGLRYGTDSVQKGIARFLGITETQAAGDLVFQRFPEYIGEIVENGADTREVDYINLVAAGANDLNTLLRYLYIPSEPHRRAELISKHYEIKTLYSNVRVVLNAEYIDKLSSLVASGFRPLWEQSMVENNIGALGTGQGNAFATGPSFGIGATGNGWNGFTMNPFG
jgi:hypothetical protein